jgi:hypothetical protein
VLGSYFGVNFITVPSPRLIQYTLVASNGDALGVVLPLGEGGRRAATIGHLNHRAGDRLCARLHRGVCSNPQIAPLRRPETMRCRAAQARRPGDHAGGPTQPALPLDALSSLVCWPSPTSWARRIAVGHRQRGSLGGSSVWYGVCVTAVRGHL